MLIDQFFVAIAGFSSRPRSPRIAATALALLIAATSPLAAAENPPPVLQLEKLVMLVRHGARSPNQTPAELAKSAARPWPEWPVAAGELTERGVAQMTALGGYYRQRYAAEGLLPAQGCPQAGSIASWADSSVRRVPLSAQALLDGLFPGCGLKAAHAPPADADPVFHPAAAEACPINPAKARAAVLAAAGGDLDRALRSVRPGMQKLQAIVAVRSAVNCADTAPSCGLDGQANALTIGSDGVKLEGGLKLAATLGENFLLEYVQGMAAGDVGWGEAAAPAALVPLLGPRNLYTRLLHRTPYLASHEGAPLARALLAALDDTAADADADVNAPPRASRLMVFVGRDLHLANLAGMLGLDWSLPDQPDDTPLGATLAFERLRDPSSGRRYVRTALYYQSLQQMRAGSALDRAHPPARRVLKIPGCDKAAVDGACPLPLLRERLTAALPTDCPMAAAGKRR